MSRNLRRSHPLLRQLVGSSLVLLCILLPVLLAFVRIDEMPGAKEQERVGRAILAPADSEGDLLCLYYAMTLSEKDASAWPEKAHQITSRARLAGMLALLGITAELYLLVLLARGRAVALLSCLALGVLPPVLEQGYVLRPEQCSTLFGLLGMLLLLGYPDMLLRARRRAWPLRFLGQLCLIACVGVAFGLATASLSSAWIHLVMPAAGLMLVLLGLGLVLPRATKRKSVAYWPLRAAAHRYVPWVNMLMGTFLLVYLMLQLAAGGRSQAPTYSAVGLWPLSWWCLLPVVLLAGLGALRLLLATGLRLGRQRRLRPDTLLLVYVAIVLMQAGLGSRPSDQLPAAPALAFLVGDGALTSLFFLHGWLDRGVAGRR